MNKTLAAAAELDRLEVEPVVNPLEELARLAAKARAWEELLAGNLAELATLMQETAGGGVQLNTVIPLWERALDRCGQFCATLARPDIDQRIVKIQATSAKIIGAEIAGLISRVFDRCEFDYRPDTVRAIVAEEIGETPAEAVQVPPGLARYNGNGAA